LTRQKTILALLAITNKPISRMVFVKLMFLLRHETAMKGERSFYDFVPYMYGPFSFALYRDLTNLSRDGYVILDAEQVSLCKHTAYLTEKKIDELPSVFSESVDKVVRRHGGKSQMVLVEDVYHRYPWYATRSELTGIRTDTSVATSPTTQLAVYTVGYEGKSVDAFFDHLLRKGIKRIIDVRNNPMSRCYGFSKKQLTEIAAKLGLDYDHIPRLGIPKQYRTHLTDFESYQSLLQKYAVEMLPSLDTEIDMVGTLMQESPSTLLCVEKDVNCCHRGRLADAVSRRTGLEVKHI